MCVHKNCEYFLSSNIVNTVITDQNCEYFLLSNIVNTVIRIVNTLWCAFPLLSRISQCSNKGKGQEAIDLHSKQALSQHTNDYNLQGIMSLRMEPFQSICFGTKCSVSVYKAIHIDC